jgi:hypothetical protein
VREEKWTILATTAFGNVHRHAFNQAGLMQADAYAGFTKFCQANRTGGPVIKAACWAHARRKFFELARPSETPIAAEAVKRIDVLSAIEREINGLKPQQRLCERLRTLSQQGRRQRRLPSRLNHPLNAGHMIATEQAVGMDAQIQPQACY